MNRAEFESSPEMSKVLQLLHQHQDTDKYAAEVLRQFNNNADIVEVASIGALSCLGFALMSFQNTAEGYSAKFGYDDYELQLSAHKRFSNDRMPAAKSAFERLNGITDHYHRIGADGSSFFELSTFLYYKDIRNDSQEWNYDATEYIELSHPEEVLETERKELTPAQSEIPPDTASIYTHTITIVQDGKYAVSLKIASYSSDAGIQQVQAAYRVGNISDTNAGLVGTHAVIYQGEKDELKTKGWEPAIVPTMSYIEPPEVVFSPITMRHGNTSVKLALPNGLKLRGNEVVFNLPDVIEEPLPARHLESALLRLL